MTKRTKKTMPTKRSWLELGVSVLSAAGIGAATMYLLDPEAGERRRANARHRLAHYVSATGETVTEHAHAISQGTQRLARGAADTLHDFAERKLHRERHSKFGLIAGAIGALTVGAGLMFLLDPSEGRRRRALIRDKAASAASATAHCAESTGRYIADKAAGITHRVTGGDNTVDVGDSVASA